MYEIQHVLELPELKVSLILGGYPMKNVMAMKLIVTTLASIYPMSLNYGISARSYPRCQLCLPFTFLILFFRK